MLEILGIVAHIASNIKRIGVNELTSIPTEIIRKPMVF